MAAKKSSGHAPLVHDDARIVAGRLGPCLGISDSVRQATGRDVAPGHFTDRRHLSRSTFSR